jgi:hypothetical protein
VIYKYDLSEAVKQTKEIVDDQQWLESMRDLDTESAKDKMGIALEPIAQRLLNVSGEAMVDEIPEEVITWIFDSAVVLAASEGTISQEEAVQILSPKCEECVEWVQEERVVEVEVEKIVEKVVYEQVPVETIVERIVEVPVETIVYVNKTQYVDKIEYVPKIVEKEKIVYVDKPVEVEKIVYREKDCPETKQFTQGEIQTEASIEEDEQDIEEDEEEPVQDTTTRKSKSERSRSNEDEYTYNLYAEGAYYYTYHGYAVKTNDYQAFDSYNYDGIDYYYDNYDVDTTSYYNADYYNYYLAQGYSAPASDKKGLFETIKSWFSK